MPFPRFLLAALAVLLALPPGASAASVAGTVNSQATAAPVVDYAVDLYDSNKELLESRCTSATGTYSFTALAAGTYYVKFSGDGCTAGGFAPSWYDGWLTGQFADPIVLDAATDKTGVNAALDAEGIIRGTVRDDGAVGVPNVSVRAIGSDGAEERRTCTAADGSYELRRMTPLPYIVLFVSDATCGVVAPFPNRYYKFDDPQGAATAAAASSVSADTGQTTSGIDVRLVPAAPAQHTLTVAVTGSGAVTDAGGSISCPGTCSATLPEGSVVTLMPAAQAGSAFTGWTGACSGAGACSVTLDGDKAVGATFAAQPAGGTPGGGSPGGGATGGSGTGGSGAGGAGTITTPTTIPPPTGPPAAVPVPSTTTAADAKAKCALATPSKPRKGRFTVRVRCDRRARLALTGTVSYKRGKRTVKVKLAGSTATATTRTASLRVPAAALRARRPLTLVLTLRATTSAGTTIVTTRPRRL
jgi:hypothetical protein